MDVVGESVDHYYVICARFRSVFSAVDENYWIEINYTAMTEKYDNVNNDWNTEYYFALYSRLRFTVNA